MEHVLHLVLILSHTYGDDAPLWYKMVEAVLKCKLSLHKANVFITEWCWAYLRNFKIYFVQVPVLLLSFCLSLQCPLCSDEEEYICFSFVCVEYFFSMLCDTCRNIPLRVSSDLFNRLPAFVVNCEILSFVLNAIAKLKYA